MIQISANGRRYALGYGEAGNHVVSIFDSATDKVLLTLEDRSDEFLSISPDSKQIATLFDGITIYDIETEKELWNFKPNFELIHFICFSPDGTLFAAAGEFETDCDFNDLYMTSVALWDMKTGKNLWEHRCGLIRKILFSPDGKKLYTIGTADVNRNLTSKISCAEITKGAFREIFREKLRLRFWDFDISPDGNNLVCSGNYYHYKQNNVPLIIVDLNSERKKVNDSHSTYFTKDEIKRLIGHTTSVNSVMYSPDGSSVASSSSDGTLRIWDVNTSKQIHEIKAYTKEMTFSIEGSVLIFLHGGFLHFYDTSNWNLTKKKKVF